MLFVSSHRGRCSNPRVGNERWLPCCPRKTRSAWPVWIWRRLSFWLPKPTLLICPACWKKLQPQELVCGAGESCDTGWSRQVCRTERPAEAFRFEQARTVLSKQFGRKRIDTLVFSHRRALCAAGAVFAYARETQRAFLPHIRAPESYRHDAFVVLDPQTQRNLELVENVFEGSPEGTVLAVLDHTTTRMGKRRLRHWVLHPLRAVDEIHTRQEAIAELSRRHDIRAELRRVLSGLPDLERLTSRITSAIANPRDLAALKSALVRLPDLHAALTRGREPSADDVL